MTAVRTTPAIHGIDELTPPVENVTLWWVVDLTLQRSGTFCLQSIGYP
jgi:hypothetical protein